MAAVQHISGWKRDDQARPRVKRLLTACQRYRPRRAKLSQEGHLMKRAKVASGWGAAHTQCEASSHCGSRDQPSPSADITNLPPSPASGLVPVSPVHINVNPTLHHRPSTSTPKAPGLSPDGLQGQCPRTVHLCPRVLHQCRKASHPCLTGLAYAPKRLHLRLESLHPSLKGLYLSLKASHLCLASAPKGCICA